MSEPRYIPARESPAFARWFEGWCRRNMIRKKFGAMRIERGSADLLRSAAAHTGPLILASNHVGWWDPLIMLTTQRLFFPDRSLRAPMDAAQLERFGLFRRLGVFGIDPDDAASLARMGDEMGHYFRESARPTFWITPQGRFADVRAPIVVRPGVSALAAASPGARGLALSVEYCFWTDPKPEILIAAREVRPTDPARTTAWQRAITEAMTAGAAHLAGLAIARDPAPFETLVSKRGAQGGALYDAWLRLRGRGEGLAAHRAGPAAELARANPPPTIPANPIPSRKE
jgi:hypothetical protein